MEDVREVVSGPVLVLGTTEAEDVSRVLIGFRDDSPVDDSGEGGVQQ